MGFSDRPWDNRILYFIYRFLIIVHNSCWYYFAPFLFKYGAFFWLLDQNSKLGKENHEGAEGGGEEAPEGHGE